MHPEPPSGLSERSPQAVAPGDVFLMPGTCECDLSRKKIFVDVIELGTPI